MKKIILISSAILSLSACNNADEASSINEKPMPTLIAELMATDNTDGKSTGSATIETVKDGSKLTVSIADMKAGSYGMHLHAVGKCDAPDFKSAGGHWNPKQSEHGLKNPKGFHGGDLPNLVVEADGTVNQTTHIAHFNADAADAFMDEDGAAFVIHAGPDDNVSDPSGNSGARIFCGVFKQLK